MKRYACEICGLVRPENELDSFGWVTRCLGDPECRSPMLHPKQREAVALSVDMLDAMEDHADISDNACMGCDITPSQLRALIDAARRCLSD